MRAASCSRGVGLWPALSSLRAHAGWRFLHCVPGHQPIPGARALQMVEKVCGEEGNGQSDPRLTSIGECGLNHVGGEWPYGFSAL